MTSYDNSSANRVEAWQELSLEEQENLVVGLDREKSALKVINGFAADLISIPSKNELAWYVAREVVGKLGFIDCVVYFTDDEQPVLRQTAAIGPGKNPVSNHIVNPMIIPIGQGITGTVAQRREAMIVNDLEGNEIYIPDIDPALSEICVPLIDGDAIYGVIDCEDPEPNRFSSEHLEILTTVAAIASAKLRLLKQDQRLELATRLHEAEERFRDFAEIASDWYWELGDDLRYTYMSPKMEFHTSLPSSFFLGRTRAEVRPDDVSDDDWRSHLDDLAARRPIRNFVQSRLTSDGVRVWQSLNAKPLFDDQGTFRGYRGTGADITSLMLAEQSMRRALVEAERANAAKSEFLSSMSHELRTPMNSILGFGQLLEFDRNDPLTERQEFCVGQIMNGGKHLMELIDQVLDLERIESGNLDLSIEEIELHRACSECLSLIDGQAQMRSLTVDREITATRRIEADYSRFKQVLLNFLSNAVKYNAEGGTIKLICADAADGKVRISVTDTGTGIAIDKQGGMFTPFNRLGKEAGEVPGTGIGLTIAKQLVETMGGRIGFESEFAKGSTFWIEFPAI